MSANVLKDILMDDQNRDYDTINVTLFLVGIGLLLFSGYDLYKAWQAYDLLLATWTKLASASPPLASLPPLPVTPKFDSQAYGIACGALISSYGAKKWLAKTADSGSTSEVRDSQ